MDRSPPTADDLLEICRRTMAPEYWRIVESDPEGIGAVYRGLAESLAHLARRLHVITQAGYFLPWSREDTEPSTFARKATMDVDLYRTFDRDAGIVMDPGRVWLEGPEGRRYTNTSQIVWPPSGVTTIRSTFEAEFAGWTWNLDHLANTDGLLVTPQVTPEEPWLDRVDLRMSEIRSGTGATIEIDGETITITDSGAGDVLTANDVGCYLRITDADNVGNVGQIVRLVTHERATTPSPEGSRFYASTMQLDADGHPHAILAAVLDDGGAFSTLSSPYLLLPASIAVADAVYFGLHEPFTRLFLTVTEPSTGDITLAWEFWNGAAWVALTSVSDGPAAFRQSGTVSWAVPVGWASTTVNGIGAFWVRARVVAATAAGGGQASVAYVGVPYPLVAEADSVSWQVLRWQDLGFQVTRMTAPTGGREDTLGLLGAERQVYRSTGESEDSFRARASRLAEAIAPLAIHNAVNRILAPYGMRARVFDVGTDGLGGPGIPGLFFDTGADSFPAALGFFDLYDPADPPLPSKYFLPLADYQANRHFFVALPPTAFGDFGDFFDVAGYFDVAYFDGYAVTTLALYDAIEQTLRALKLLGVSFTFILDPDLLAPC